MKKAKRTKWSRIRTCAGMCSELRRFFEDDTLFNGGSEQRKLWDVLTGLRGPDDESTLAKTATTAVIRRAVFEGNHHIPAHVEPDSCDFTFSPSEKVELRKQHDDAYGGNHFWRHAHRAFKALGLKWNEVNEEGKR